MVLASRPQVGELKRNAFFQTIGYKPHAGQLQYHNSLARFRLANCGRRFGKSTMAAKDLEPKLFLKDRIYWIVAPTYDLGEKEFRVIWNDLIVMKKLGQDKTIRRAYNKKQGSMFIEFTQWNTRLEVRSAQHPENLVGESLDHVIMSEAAKHDADTWERYIRPSLADKRGSADFPTTPEGFNWLYEVWMLGQNDKFPDYESWKFPSWANLEVYPGGRQDPEIVQLKETMSFEAFEQEIAADFSSFVGKIYPEWDVAEHTENMTFNPAWPNYMAVDFGYANPLAAIEFQVSPDEQIYVWREHYKSHTTLDDHISIMKNRVQPVGYHLDLIFGDAADPEGVVSMATKLAPAIGLPEAKVNWREGIDLVRSFMKGRETGLTDLYGGPLYRSGFHVSLDCVNLIREFNNYKSNTNSNGKNVTEMGVKADDHALDALRYGLVHIFILGATASLSEIMDLNRNKDDSGNQYKEMNTNDGLASTFGSPSESGFFTTAGSF